jgi:glycosyltransferase involved in cell wall biosynthesis
MAKNVLVFFPHPLHPSSGGAYSYLFQLRKAFPEGDVKLCFLHELLGLDEEKVARKQKPVKWKIVLRKLLPRKVIYSRRISRYVDEMYSEAVVTGAGTLDYSPYDAIHFHETVDLWRCRRFLAEFKGKIILTSHSPKPYHLELLEDVFGLQKHSISRRAYKKLEVIDRVAFSFADIVVSPSAESLEDYGTSWEPFASLVKKKKLVFLPTGIDVPNTTRHAAEVRQQWDIPHDAFVVCFNGRHQPVKGYDILVAAASILLPENPQLTFLVTGKADDPQSITHPRWVQTGWTSHPQDILNASDLVVVPNRQTFFDLNVLQALALGKPVLLSETGGNKTFWTFNESGIMFLSELTTGALVKAITVTFAQRLQLAERAPVLTQLFQDHFSAAQFAANYQRFYLSV